MTARSNLAASTSSALAPVVVQMGVYRSASTWASNAIAALLQPWGPVRIVFDDTLVPATLGGGSGERFVVKVHRPSAALLDRMSQDAPPLVITIREPLDCVASMMTQFGEPFDRASAVIAQSCHAVLFLRERASLVLRYEDHPRDAATVRLIAEALDMPGTDTATIADALSPARVMAYIDGLIADGTFGPNPSVAHSDARTHWHPNHLGSGETDRYLSVLSKPEIATVVRLTAPFRDAFGYAAR